MFIWPLVVDLVVDTYYRTTILPKTPKLSLLTPQTK